MEGVQASTSAISICHGLPKNQRRINLIKATIPNTHPKFYFCNQQKLLLKNQKFEWKRNNSWIFLLWILFLFFLSANASTLEIQDMNPIIRYRLKMQLQDRLKILNNTSKIPQRPTSAQTFPDTNKLAQNLKSSMEHLLRMREAQEDQNEQIPIVKSNENKANNNIVDSMQNDRRNCFFSPIQCHLPVFRLNRISRFKAQKRFIPANKIFSRMFIKY